MMKVYGRQITQEDMNLIGSYMDDEIREDIHARLAPCKPEEFIRAYLEEDPNFLDLLENEFEFEDNRYMLIDDCGTDYFVDYYETEAEAVKNAEITWNRLTRYEKKHRNAFYVGYGTLSNHDTVKEWK